MKPVVKYALITLAGIATVPLTLFVLAKAGADLSPLVKMMDSFSDKSARASTSAVATGTFGTAHLSVNYSQPAKKGRQIFGEVTKNSDKKVVVPFGEVWRTGANEATTITLDKDILVAGKPLKAGQYQLFTIPRADNWTIIFNTKAGQWGAFFYDKSSNALEVDVPASMTDTALERMTIGLDSAGLAIAWDKTKVVVPITQ
jgi:hypothetical protein